MVSFELFVELHLQELGVDVCQLVVGQDQAGDVLIVLCLRTEAGVGGQVVVRQVQDCGPVGDRGEVSEAAVGAVDNDRVGPKPEIMEDTGAKQRASGVDMARVDTSYI